MAKTREMWVFNPPKQPNHKVPEVVKAKANDLIEAVLKPNHIKPASEDARVNYIVDIYSKWYQNYFYFCAKYACPGPNAISPFFETKFARLEYVGNECFNLAYMRHTGKWGELHTELSLVECLDAIRDEPHFLP